MPFIATALAGAPLDDLGQAPRPRSGRLAVRVDQVKGREALPAFAQRQGLQLPRRQFLGIEDAEFVFAEGLALGDAPRSESLARARSAISRLGDEALLAA